MRLDVLPPRIRRMIGLIVANRQAIVGPARGMLTIYFRGPHVGATLYADPMPLREEDPPKTA